jgi:polyhydroxyalkanoate synthesis repressor PhaR
MIRLVKRYESRNLYDTEESRYVGLGEVGEWVRAGQQIRVVDNASGDDVTAQILTQVILEGGKRGEAPLSSEFLHELLRAGEKAWNDGVQRVQEGVDRAVAVSVDRLKPLREAREEMGELRRRLDELESTLGGMESR